MRRWVVAIVAIAVGLVIAISVGIWLARHQAPNPTTLVQIAHTNIQTEIVESDELRAKGLSGRDSIAPNQGMLFIFDRESKWGIWMKDMKFSIDIIWLNKDQKIVDIAEDVSPQTYPKIFAPDAAAKYVLEVPAGAAEKSEFKVGQHASFSLP